MHIKKRMLVTVFGLGAAVSTPTNAGGKFSAITPSGLDCGLRSDTTPENAVTETVPFAGKSITLTIPNKPRYYAQVEVRQKIMSAIDNINKNTHKINPADVKIVQNINHIVLSDMISRSGVEEKSGVFYLKIHEVMKQNVGYLSSNIAHDSFHIEQYKRGGYAASRSTQAEVEAIDFQMRLMPALVIEEKSLVFLRKYQKDPQAINTRRQPGLCD